jgi:hypothetical protein
MSEDIECNKLFTVSLSLKHYDESVEDTVQEKLYWDGKESGQASIGWCVGTHIASAIERLFPGDSGNNERKDCLASILDLLGEITETD